MRTLRIHLLALLVIGLFAFGACGSDDDGSTDGEDAGTDMGTDSGGDTGVDTSDDTANDTGSDTVDEEVSTAPTLDDVHSQVFSMTCAGSTCHIGGSAYPSFEADGNLHSRLMGPSTQTGLNIIEPSSPDDSYLWHKVSGTQTSVGGSGSQMPLTGDLTSDQMDLIEEWILAGAPE